MSFIFPFFRDVLFSPLAFILHHSAFIIPIPLPPSAFRLGKSASSSGRRAAARRRSPGDFSATPFAGEANGRRTPP
jgi:hypothetical protein